MEYTIARHDKHCEVRIQGSFTFSDNAKFRELLNSTVNDTLHSLTINLSKLEFIDSAALGMLLLLNDAASQKNIRITLAAATGQIKKMLVLSKFEELFNIED